MPRKTAETEPISFRIPKSTGDKIRTIIANSDHTKTSFLLLAIDGVIEKYSDPAIVDEMATRYRQNLESSANELRELLLDNQTATEHLQTQ